MDATVIVPTYNERGNISELVARIAEAVTGRDARLLFVDDSTDDTIECIRAAANATRLPVSVIHRDHPVGGLSGAVRDGIRASDAEWVVVMDGDLQHPPELIPVLLDLAASTHADVAVASRYVRGGSHAGLSSAVRTAVSRASTLLARAMFPIRLRDCTDPMTGFFALRRASVDAEALRPRGFKILLEVLARHHLDVVEEPFVFSERHSGESKASMSQGLRYLQQLAALRFGRMSAFAVVGAIGALANVLIMAGLQAAGVWYITGAIVAAIVTIVGNFVLLEHFVFQDLRNGRRRLSNRFVRSFAFNGSETLVRTFLLWVIVEETIIPSVLVQAGLLAVGFLARFVYHSRIVYAPADRVRDVDSAQLDVADSDSAA